MIKRKLYSSLGELWRGRRQHREELMEIASYSNFPLFIIQVTNLMLLFYLFKYCGSFTLFVIDKIEIVNTVIENENYKLVADVFVGAGLVKLVTGNSRLGKIISFKDIFRLDRKPSLLLFVFLSSIYLVSFLCEQILNYFEQKNGKQSTRTI